LVTVTSLTRTTRTIVLSALLALSICSASSACPMCKDSIPNSDSAQPVAVPSGFNRSVYTLLVGFLVVLGGVSMMIVKVIREPNATGRGFNVVSQQQQQKKD
jgi:hypothetical protein